MHNQPSFDEFCRWFPSLAQHFDDVAEITANKLRAFLESSAVTSGSDAATRFVLAVWNCNRFKFSIAAVGSWDSAHRAAFARWATDPFWY